MQVFSMVCVVYQNGHTTKSEIAFLQCQQHKIILPYVKCTLGFNGIEGMRENQCPGICLLLALAH